MNYLNCLSQLSLKQASSQAVIKKDTKTSAPDETFFRLARMIAAKKKKY